MNMHIKLHIWTYSVPWTGGGGEESDWFAVVEGWSCDSSVATPAMTGTLGDGDGSAVPKDGYIVMYT